MPTPIDPPGSMAGDVSIDFTVVAGRPLRRRASPRSRTIQGVDDTADVTGPVTTEGVVVSDDEGPSPTLRGFYIQDPAGDGDAATSDGIFVFNGNNDTVANGDLVRVTGTAAEFQGQTQISASSIVVCGPARPSPRPTSRSRPPRRPRSRPTRACSSACPQDAVRHRALPARPVRPGRSSRPRAGSTTDRRRRPGAPAIALQARRTTSTRSSSTTRCRARTPTRSGSGRGGDPLSATNTLRGGDTVDRPGRRHDLHLGRQRGQRQCLPHPAAQRARWRRRDFQPANPRPAAPVEVGGNVRVAGMNLLNYFNTFDGLPTASTTAHRRRRPADRLPRRGQPRPNSIGSGPRPSPPSSALDADVIGVNEIENDGYGPTAPSPTSSTG